MGTRVGIAMPVADIAGALADDPAALVELLVVLAAKDMIEKGAISAAMAGHAPVRHDVLEVFIGRLVDAFGVAVAA